MNWRAIKGQHSSSMRSLEKGHTALALVFAGMHNATLTAHEQEDEHSKKALEESYFGTEIASEIGGQQLPQNDSACTPEAFEEALGRQKLLLKPLFLCKVNAEALKSLSRKCCGRTKRKHSIGEPANRFCGGLAEGPRKVLGRKLPDLI